MLSTVKNNGAIAENTKKASTLHNRLEFEPPKKTCEGLGIHAHADVCVYMVHMYNFKISLCAAAIVVVIVIDGNGFFFSSFLAPNHDFSPEIYRSPNAKPVNHARVTKRFVNGENTSSVARFKENVFNVWRERVVCTYIHARVSI